MIKCNSPCPINNFEGCCSECDLNETCIEACGLNPLECDDSIMMDDIFQVDYPKEKRELRINLPKEAWESVDTIVLTKLFKEEIVVEKKNGGE